MPTSSRPNLVAATITLATICTPVFAGDVFTRLTDLRPGLQSGVPNLSGLVHDNAFWFIGYVDDFDTRIYRYDGVNPPVAQVGATVFPDELIGFGGEFVFRGGGLSDRELWRWNGAAAPFEAFDLLPSGSAFPEDLTVFGDELCFRAQTTLGSELVCWDGVSSPTTFDVWPGTSGSRPDNFGVVDGKLYFEGGDSTIGTEGRVYDGNTAPTVLFDLRPGLPSSGPEYWTQYEDDLYFSANAGSGFHELLRKQPAQAPVVDPNGVQILGELAVHGGALIVPGVDPEEDTQQLHLLRDGEMIRLSGRTDFVASYLPFANAIYFTAGAGVVDRDIYRWCGSESVDLVSDFFSSTSAALAFGKIVAFDGKILFAATDGQGTGTELWSLEPMTAIFCSGFLSGDNSEWSSTTP